MASSCSISCRCGLTSRITSRSAITFVQSTRAGSKWTTGGIAVPQTGAVLTKDFSDLRWFGQQNVGAISFFSPELRTGIHGVLVLSQEGGTHAKPARGRD